MNQAQGLFNQIFNLWLQYILTENVWGKKRKNKADTW